ncbi:hypothetical protein ACLMJK_007060 [Lecanora helva]
MLAAVFFCQPFGQLIAVLMAFAATAGFKSYIASASVTTSCSVIANDPTGEECARTVDRAWRLVAGLGAVPAAVAIVFRLTIPESVYYNLDIKNDSQEAMRAREYFGSEDDLGHDDHPLPESLEPSLHSNAQADGVVVELLEDPNQIKASRQDFYKYLFTDGNWTDLFATSVGWMLLDFTFYLLGVNSSSFVPRMYGEERGPSERPYQLLIRNARHIMESTTIGSLVGGLLAILIMHHYSRRKIQAYGFLVLGALFVIVGALYMTLPTTNAHAVIVVFYGICQLFYNLGPNTTTFIIPAESFPTRYRCTCYGISAAAGKLGSVLGQIVVTKVTSPKRLGLTLILFVIVMLVGAANSIYLVPETCDSKGRSHRLEDLGKGKAHRTAIEKAESEHVEAQQKRQ